MKTPCKGIIYIAKGNALDREQRDFLISWIIQLDIHIAEKHGDVDFFIGNMPYFSSWNS